MEWLKRAACTGKPVGWWYGDLDTAGRLTDDLKRGIEICQTCAVREACLEHAITTREKYGTWGGLTEQQRRTQKKQAAQAAREAAEERSPQQQQTLF